MDADLLQKLTSLITTLQGEGKTDLVSLATKALQLLKGGDVASGMSSLLEASKLDSRFKDLLGKGGETAAELGGLAKAASGILGKLV